MAKAKSIQTTNTNLLYARVVRADGTKTFINKVNANGYGTDARGAQIHRTRIVQAGRVLKELPEAMDKTEFVLSAGIAHKLTKREQKMLANGEDKFLDFKSIDVVRLQFVEPDAHHAKAAGKNTSRQAVRHTSAEKPTAKRARKTAKAEGIEVDLLTKKSQTAPRKKERKAADTSIIKEMPRELKRLIQDSVLKLNAKQTEQVLISLGLDAQFYAKSVESNFDGLYLALPAKKEKTKAKARNKQRAPQYATAKESAKLLKKLKTKLVAPSEKYVAQHKKKVKEVRIFWQNVLGLNSPGDVKRGLLIVDDYGEKYALIAIDQVSTVFVRTDGSNERLIAHSLLSLKSGHAKFTLAPSDELDVAV